MKKRSTLSLAIVVVFCFLSDFSFAQGPSYPGHQVPGHPPWQTQMNNPPASSTYFPPQHHKKDDSKQNNDQDPRFSDKKPSTFEFKNPEGEEQLEFSIDEKSKAPADENFRYYLIRKSGEDIIIRSDPTTGKEAIVFRSESAEKSKPDKSLEFFFKNDPPTFDFKK